MTCAGCDDCTFQHQDVPLDHHEIHITVRPEDNQMFPDVCRRLGIKPILVHTDRRDGLVHDEAMTSHKFRGTYDEARGEAERIMYRMILARISPVRAKIETSPSDIARADHPGGYWEAHLELSVPVKAVDEFRKYIYTIPSQYLSRNPNKQTPTHVGFMLTQRGYGIDRAEFLTSVHEKALWLSAQGLDIGRRMIEYCWYDSNPGHDAVWMGA